MKTFYKLVLMSLLFAIPIALVADDFLPSHIIAKTESCKSPGRRRVTKLTNVYHDSVEVRLHNDFDGQNYDVILASGATWKYDKTCTVILAKPLNTPKARYIEVNRFNTPDTILQHADGKLKDENHKKGTAEKTINDKTPTENLEKNPPTKTISSDKVIKDFLTVIDTMAVYSGEQIKKDSVVITTHVDNLLYIPDKKIYIEDKKIDSLILAQRTMIEDSRSRESTLIAEFLKRYKADQISKEDDCKDVLRSLLEERLSQREANLRPLEEIIKKAPKDINWNLIGVCIVSAILLIGLFVWYKKASKKLAQKTTKPTPQSSAQEMASLIVVGQKSLPSLKKQSLNDVYENEAYLKIECKEFCSESAVRAIYIKNTCVKDLYNMYAEDLRNPNNPKEDGCMVIGRWVQDMATKQYDVSLEYIVTPGDDAVFAEYELNFGGKIQLKKADMLKRLRRDTGLQYDLTCWVHSHPGLGVFFSNSDNNVQMQLKNDLHPHFLTALVVDILTPKQETGIFTFKPDDTVNSKNDLTKMYSLEEMYKWAIESERRSFNKDDFFNALCNAKKRIFECYGIELSNGTIIDMAYMASNSNGFVGLVHGYSLQQGEKLECITTSVTKISNVSDSEVIGCFVVAAHCSIPSIRKAIAQYLGTINFVLVYTATDGLITSIPVVNRDLCNNEDYYGEHLLEDLKIWTRRKR